MQLGRLQGQLVSTVESVGNENACRWLLEVDLVAQNLHVQALPQEYLQHCVRGRDCGRVDVTVVVARKLHLTLGVRRGPLGPLGDTQQ